MISTKNSNNQNHGFTIVELLIVVVVIGILAGISIVGYGAWRKNVATSQLKSELNGVASAMESARNFGSGYPTTIPTTFKPSSDVTLTYKSGDSKTYCIEATTVQDASIKFRYDLSEKKEPQSGACGAIVIPTVANLMHNPNPTSGSYWAPSSTSQLSLSYLSSGGYDTVRTTRVGTSAAALYGERNGVGVTTASTGDKHTVIFTVSSNITTSVVFLMGYGNSGSTATLTGSDSTINLVANVPQTILQTVTVPSGITAQNVFFKVLWTAGYGAIGDYFDVNRVMWVPGVYTGAYGDGNSSGWSWDGATNLSTSSGPSL